MTRLLDKAFAEASKMPEDDQDALARLILDELAADQGWQASFDCSRDALANPGDEALDELRRGETKPLIQ